MITHLYLVMDEDGDNDLFVSAHDPEEATKLWREQYPYLATVPSLMYVVPAVSDVPRIHPWHDEVEAI